MTSPRRRASLGALLTTTALALAGCAQFNDAKVQQQALLAQATAITTSAPTPTGDWTPAKITPACSINIDCIEPDVVITTTTTIPTRGAVPRLCADVATWAHTTLDAALDTAECTRTLTRRIPVNQPLTWAADNVPPGDVDGHPAPRALTLTLTNPNITPTTDVPETVTATLAITLTTA
ncbi:MAG: hypothetical protein GC157_17405 [Frankiales bacterium]|nr:hypothetical protein [Frankiales bacterium]